MATSQNILISNITIDIEKIFDPVKFFETDTDDFPVSRIVARVIAKSDLLTGHNDGQRHFTVNFLDTSGEIRATAFNKECDKFYEMLQVRKIYSIDYYTITTAKKEFCIPMHDYEIHFQRDTEVTEIPEIPEIPFTHYNFCKIEDVNSVKDDKLIDVIGICIRYDSDVTDINIFSGPNIKRDIEIWDGDTEVVKLTFFDKFAESFDGSEYPIVVVRGVRVTSYQGKKGLTCTPSCIIEVNPDIQEARDMRNWFDEAAEHNDGMHPWAQDYLLYGIKT